MKEGAVAKKLFMNPGPADATTGWDMNDATTAMGLAAVFKLNNGEATWKLLRLKQPTAAEKAEIMRSAGLTVVTSPAELGQTVVEALKRGRKRPVAAR